MALNHMRDGMFVPPELTEQLLRGIRKNRSIGVMFSFEMLPTLHAKGFKDVILIVQERPKKYIRNLCTKYGYAVKTIEEIKNMKFDTMIANPPYQNGKNSNFYMDFIRLSKEVVKDGGDIIFVVPNRFCMNGSKLTNLLNEFQLKHITWNASSHFPNVGTFIGAYVATNKANPDNTKVPVDFGSFTRDINFETETLPPKPINNELKISIIEKYFNHPTKCDIVKKDDDGAFFICRQWKSYVPEDKSRSGVVFNTVDQDKDDGRFYKVIGDTDNFISFVSRSKLMRFIAINFASGMNVAPIIQRTIPDIGFQDAMTDQQIYDVFGLNEEEISYIDRCLTKGSKE